MSSLSPVPINSNRQRLSQITGKSRGLDGRPDDPNNGVSVAGKSLPEFLKMISGPADESVKLELFDSKREQSQTVTLSRGKFLVPNEPPVVDPVLKFGT